MKRIVSGVAVVVMLLVMGGVVRAEEGAESTEISAGVKTWINSWKNKAPDASRTANSILIGPAIEAEFSNHIFVEASYMTSVSDYKLSETEKLNRNDFDLAAGYMFNHNVGAFAGYRNSAFKEKETGAKETLSGPLVGVRGSVPLNEAFSLFGKATYLNTTMKTDTDSEASPGWIAEAGVKYAFCKCFSASLGYKYETTKGKDSHIDDTFSGATLDVMYTF